MNPKGLNEINISLSEGEILGIAGVTKTAKFLWQK